MALKLRLCFVGFVSTLHLNTNDPYLSTLGKENPPSEKERDEGDPYSSAEYDRPGSPASC